MTIQKLDKSCLQAKTFKIQYGCHFHGNEKRDALQHVLKLIALSMSNLIENDHSEIR